MKVNWRNHVITVLAFIGLNIYACTEIESVVPEPTNGEGEVLPDGTIFTRAGLLEAVAECVMDELTEFNETSQTLVVLANSALDGQSGLTELKEAWRRTIDAWQQIEVMQFGPAGRGTIPGGQDLRNKIYAWPLLNPCAIDEHLVSESYLGDDSSILDTANGLGAAEYLLFQQDSESQCAVDNEIITSGSWNGLDASMLSARRLAYAVYAANTVKSGASELLNAWDPEEGNFFKEVVDAGADSRIYGKKRVAINAISDALFYVEWATKDNKLARPLGLRGCSETYCVDLVESYYARHSKSHLRNNISGFRKIFTGCGDSNAGLGFDDYLYAVGQEDLANAIDSAALEVINTIDALEQPDLVQALENDLEGVSAIHDAMSELTDLLRYEFLAVLNLELPQLVQGDND